MTKFLKISILCCFAVAGVFGGQSRAQMGDYGDVAGVSETPPQVFVDYAGFKSDSAGMVRLEIYYKIHNRALHFHADGDRFVANFELRAALEDKDGIPVAVFSTEKSVVVGSEEKTMSYVDFRTSQINFDVEPQDYVLKFSLWDDESPSIYNYEEKVKLDAFNEDQPQFSQVEFARHIEETADDSSIFAKGNLIIVPSVSREYEGEENSRLVYYLELYQGKDKAEKVLVETIIRSATKGMVYRDTLTTYFDEPTERQLRDISSAELAPGRYEMELFLRGRRNKKLAEQRQPFTVLWSQRAILKHDYKTALDQISLIAGAEELGKLKNLKTLEERIKAFNDFWLARDPSVGTARNEVKEEFYRRVDYANRQFRALRREGWRSDRGRVYIMHGEPDQVDDYPMSPEYLPYQIWHYYRQGRYMRFLFVDEDLDGDYRLQYPFDGLNQRPDF
jgi:GWxTD domain-containing protein